MYVDYRLKVDNESGAVSVENLMSEKTVVSGAESRVEGAIELAEYLTKNVPAEPNNIDCYVDMDTDRSNE